MLGYSFKPRPNSRVLCIAGSVGTNGFIIRRMLSLEKPVKREKKTRLTSPEVRAATTLKARGDLGRLPFLLLDQEKDERRLCSKGGYMVDDNFKICQNIDS